LKEKEEEEEEEKVIHWISIKLLKTICSSISESAVMCEQITMKIIKTRPDSKSPINNIKEIERIPSTINCITVTFIEI
jgi:hypothetical protein